MRTAAPPRFAPDRVFPRRDTFLDAEAMAGRFAALLALDVENCDRARTTYHPGRSLRALFRVETADGRTLLVAARMFAPATSASRFARARGAAHDESLSAVLCPYPHDRKLTTLPAFLDAIPSQLVAYAPEKAAVLRTHDAFVKVYPDDGWARTARVHEALSRRGLRVPAVVACLPEHRALATEPLLGARPDVPEDYAAVGALLGRLHGLEPIDDRRFTRLDAPSVEAGANTIAAVRPDAAREAHALARAIASIPINRPRAGCVHGDAHPKNVLVADDGAALVDLDDVAAGDPAAELGGVLAGLRVRGDAADALLESYAREHELPPEATLRRHTAAALLVEHALRAVTRVRDDSLARLDETLAAGLEAIA